MRGVKRNKEDVAKEKKNCNNRLVDQLEAEDVTSRIRNTLDYVFYWIDSFSGLQKCDLDIL